MKEFGALRPFACLSLCMLEFSSMTKPQRPLRGKVKPIVEIAVSFEKLVADIAYCSIDKLIPLNLLPYKLRILYLWKKKTSHYPAEEEDLSLPS